MDDAIDEVIFQERRTAGIAAENFQGGEESCVGGEDRTGGKNFQAYLQGAAGHGAAVIFVGFGERDDGDHIADADIDHHTEFVEDAGEGGAQRDQVQDLAFADELAAAMVGILAMKAEGGGLALGACVVGHDDDLTSLLRCLLRWLALIVGAKLVPDFLLPDVA